MEEAMALTAMHQTSFPDLANPATFADCVPHDAFDDIRKLPGLHWKPTQFATKNGGFLAVIRFADIIASEKDPETFTSQRGAAFPLTNLPSDNVLKDNVMQMDLPNHNDVRRSVGKSFGPRIVAHFDTWIRAIVIEILDKIQTMPKFDYVTEVAATIPALVIDRVMGVPDSDRHRIVDWTNRTFAALQDPKTGMHESYKVVQEVMRYIVETLQPEKMRNPQDDMATAITRCLDRGELTSLECVDFLNLLSQAGFETTHTLIGQSMRMILEDPEIEATVLKAIPEVGADKVVDEFLRFITPAMNMAHTATRDTVFSGERIREGDLMQMFFTAANRDRSVFSDPHRFDRWWKETNHLAFASGVHHCVGSSLAKLELRILFEELGKGGIRLRLNGQPKRGRSFFINQLTSLPVALN
jgi:cytochrome P450